MGGRHKKEDPQHTRRAVLVATPALGIAIAAVASTGELPRTDDTVTLAEQPVPTTPRHLADLTPETERLEEFDYLIRQDQAQALAPEVEPVKPKVKRTSRSTARRSTQSRTKQTDEVVTVSQAVPARAKRLAVLATAKRYFGIRYKWGGNTPSEGMDCSGYTRYVYRQHGVNLPRVSRDQYRFSRKIKASQAVAGDLVFLGWPIHHVGIYVGDGYMYDAPRTGKTIGKHKIWSPIRRYGRVL